ncbi:MAG: NusA-like transcription termination signal-binding factor [Candidatus Thermoplasmatota archaeon]|jgi:N utilization substance protein A|nr:NusA-like transcription termination signal-binding factor [Candidatus Thermoplasmatota archaeon]MCL5794144.1 NusA-like transcription termination signal-binding factor [Candidatus Thermoplasmatota archaeon]
MKEVTIDNKIMGYIAMFEKLTRVELKQCLENEDMIIFVVGERRLQDVFGRNQDIITSLREKLSKQVLVAEASRDLLTLVRNLLFRFSLKEINISWKNGQVDILVSVDPMEVGKLIGKEGRNIKLFREAVGRFFPIKSMNVKQ